MTKPAPAGGAMVVGVVPRSYIDVLTIALLALEELDRQCRIDGDDEALARIDAARLALQELPDRRSVTT